MTPGQDQTPAPRASQKRPGYVDPDTLEELQRLARSRPRSGRQAAAKASALRTLERLERSRSHERPLFGAALRLFDESRDPNERVAEDEWLPESCEAMRELYRVETVAQRRRWYLALENAGRI